MKTLGQEVLYFQQEMSLALAEQSVLLTKQHIFKSLGIEGRVGNPSVERAEEKWK